MICNKCGLVFKTKQIIDGKERNLQNRKYCLSCSPFNIHNTKNLLLNNNVDENYKLCLKCGLVKHISNFRKRKKENGFSSYCIECSRKHDVDRFRRYKQEAVDYKGGKCEICGYKKCIGALEFHHVNPGEKDSDFHKMKRRNFNSFKSELDKCIILCSNCHREIHWLLV